MPHGVQPKWCTMPKPTATVIGAGATKYHCQPALAKLSTLRLGETDSGEMMFQMPRLANLENVRTQK